MKGKARALSDDDDDPPPQVAATTSGARPLTKRKREEVDDQGDDDGDGNVIEISSDEVCEDDEILEADPPSRPWGGQKLLDSSTLGAGSGSNVAYVDSDSEGLSVADLEEEGSWMYSHRSKPRQRGRTKSPSTMENLSGF